MRRSVGQSFTDSATGTLLLYSDGIKVFNGKTHKALDNGTGLKGADCSTPVQITPAPGGTRDLFYIFTNSNGSVWYSIADLSAQPNGRVTVKNQGPLATNTGEAQGMVPHANGRAIWLLVYNTGATVDAYLVDGPSGVVAKPVSSPTGMGSSLYKPSIVYSRTTTRWRWATRSTGSRLRRSTGPAANSPMSNSG